MRLFVAIDLPEALKESVYETLAPLREREFPVRWLEPETFHLTLKFIGEVREEERQAHAEVLRRVASGYRPVEVALDEAGAFPSLRRPSVLWVGVEATPQLRALKHDLEHGYASLGIERETRAFRPHVTVGRARDEANAGEFRNLEAAASGLSAATSFTAGRLTLMRSHLNPDGAAYSVVEPVSLEEA